MVWWREWCGGESGVVESGVVKREWCGGESGVVERVVW